MQFVIWLLALTQVKSTQFVACYEFAVQNILTPKTVTRLVLVEG